MRGAAPHPPGGRAAPERPTPPRPGAARGVPPFRAPRLVSLDLLRGALVFAMVAAHGAFAGRLAVAYPDALVVLEGVGVSAFAVISGVGYGYAARWGRGWWAYLSAAGLLLLAQAAYVGVLGPPLPGLGDGAARYALLPGLAALGTLPEVAPARWWYPGPLWPIAVATLLIGLIGSGDGAGARARLALSGLALLALGALPIGWGGGWLQGDVGTPIAPFAGAGLLGAWVGARIREGVDGRAVGSPLALGGALIAVGGVMLALGVALGGVLVAVGATLVVVAVSLRVWDRPPIEGRSNRAADAPIRRPPGLMGRRLGRIALGVLLLHATTTELAAAALRSVAPGFDAVPWAAAAFGISLGLAWLAVANALPARMRRWGAFPRRWRPRAGPPHD